MINIRELVNRNKMRVINLVFKLREKQLLANKSNGYAKASHLISKIDIYKNLNRVELNLEVQIQLNQIITWKKTLAQKWMSNYIKDITKIMEVN